MADEEVPAQGLALKTGPLLAGAVLIGIGSLLGLAGLAIAGAGVSAWRNGAAEPAISDQ